MKRSDFFEFRRLLLLIKREFYIQYRYYLVAAGAIFGLLFSLNVASILSADAWSFHSVFFPLILLPGGYAFTSASFSELADERSRAFYLGLPASTLEKFASKWIITAPGYAAVSLVLYFVFSGTVYTLTHLVFGMGHRLFDPFQETVWQQIRFYMVTQSIFLLGAVWFHKNTLLKTTLALFVFFVGFAIFAAAIAYLFYAFISLGGRPYISFRIFDLSVPEGAMPTALRGILTAAGLGADLLRILFAPFLWAVAYLRVREQEA